MNIFLIKFNILNRKLKKTIVLLSSNKTCSLIFYENYFPFQSAKFFFKVVMYGIETKPTTLFQLFFIDILKMSTRIYNIKKESILKPKNKFNKKKKKN